MPHAIRKITAGRALLVLVLLVSLFLSSTAPTAAQETAFGTLTGTAYRLVDQTIVDGVVVDQTLEPISDGRITVPELGVDEPLSANGSFRFTDLPLSADPDNPTEVTVIFTAPGLGSFTYLHLRLYPGTVGPHLTPQLTETPRVDDRSRAHGGDDGHVNISGELPSTGSGFAAGSASFMSSALLALGGAALLSVAASIRLMHRHE